MGDAALRVHAVEPWPRAIGVTCEVHQASPIQEDRIGDPPVLRGDPFRRPSGRRDAPDVQFVWEGAEDEVDRRELGDHKGK